MRIKLLNVECEFQVPVVFGRRNVYVTTVDTAASTSDMNNIAFRLCAMGYQSIHVTSQRTGNMDIYAKVKYNKPEELFDVVNQALHPSGTADNAAG